MCYYAKLNDDLISLKGDVMKVSMTEESFGQRLGNLEWPTRYEEGPWLYKRNKLYYLLFAAGPIPEHIGYATSPKPTGPWKNGGPLMATAGGSFPNHHGLADYKGNTCFFYHNGALPGDGCFTRSVCVQEMEFSKNGPINPLTMQPTGITQSLPPLNPYQKNEAKTIA